MNKHDLAGIVRKALVDPNRVDVGDVAGWTFDLFDEEEVRVDRERLRKGTLHGTGIESIFVGKGQTAKYVLGLYLLVALEEPGVSDERTATDRIEALMYALGGGEHASIRSLAATYSNYSITECQIISEVLRSLLSSENDRVRGYSERALGLFWSVFPELTDVSI